jgi:hypothetical protein
MNISYLLYQAERPLTAAQQREADITTGQLAAAIGRPWHSLRHAVTAGAETRRAQRRPAGSRPTAATGPCAVPRPTEAR